MDYLYHIFLAAVALLYIGATDADRAALLIVLAASITSLLLVDFITSGIDGSWKLVVPATIETATIISLLKWAPTRTGLMQSGCVIVAWFAHVLCFTDIELGTDLVYSKYEAVLGCVSFAQLLSCHDTIIHHLRRLGRWWTNDCPGAIRASGLAPVVSHRPSYSGALPLSPCKKTCTKP